MTKTHWLSLFRDIKATAVSFISILLFVALGIAIFLGIKWNEPALTDTADAYYREHDFQDFALSFPYGFTQDDIEAVEALDDVSLAEGAYFAYGTTWADGERCVLAVQSWTENIDRATIVEGVMPSASNEIAVEQLFADRSGLKVGDTMNIEEGSSDRDCFNDKEFIITAIVEHPAYVRQETEFSRGSADMGDGSVDFYVLADKSAFNQETYDDCYPQILIRGKNLSQWNTFGDEYAACSGEIYEKLKSLGEKRAALRCDELQNRYNTEIADAEKKIDDTEKKMENGNQELSDAKQELSDSEEKIEEGEEKIADAEKQLEEAEQEYETGEKKYKASASKLKAGRQNLQATLKSAGFSTNPEKAASQIKSAKKQLETKISGAKLMNAGQIGTETIIAELTAKAKQLDELQDAIEEYSRNVSALKRKKAELNKASGKIAESKEELASEKRRLEDAKKQLKKGKEKISKSQKKLTKGEKELAESKEELEDAKSQRDELVTYDNWFVKKRSDNPSYNIIITCSKTSEKLCYSLALLFFFVGMMVCYTAISRIVRESKVLTGVQKALGFRKREIVTHYMVYALLAVVLGAILGAALAFWGIETIINGVYAALFVYEDIPNVFFLNDFLVVTAIELVLIFLATWLPCRKLFSLQAVELMSGDNRGTARTRFYEKWKCWQRCSLYTQTTINNLVNDSTRVIATLVGVAGCTALIIMSLSLKLSLFDTPEKHFVDVGLMDDRLVYDGEVTGAKEEFAKILDEESADYTPMMQEAAYIEDTDGSKSSASIIVPEEADRIGSFIRLSDWESGADYSLPGEGALISRNYTKFRDVDVGDTIRLIDTKGNYHDCRIAGIIEYYLSSTQLIMSREYYEKMMSESPVSNMFYISYQDEPEEALTEKLAKVEGYYFRNNEHDRWARNFNNAYKSTTIVFYIGLALAAVMALLVLMDLNVVFINEKKKELIVMRINGFSVKKTKQYIYRDNIVLTILGILLGIAVGILLGIWVLSSLQRKGDNFYMAPNLTACLVGAVLSSVFSLITNLISLRQIDKMKVSDLNRVS